MKEGNRSSTNENRPPLRSLGRPNTARAVPARKRDHDAFFFGGVNADQCVVSHSPPLSTCSSMMYKPQWGMFLDAYYKV